MIFTSMRMLDVIAVCKIRPLFQSRDVFHIQKAVRGVPLDMCAVTPVSLHVVLKN
jgi:hypothetical protein